MDTASTTSDFGLISDLETSDNESNFSSININSIFMIPPTASTENTSVNEGEISKHHQNVNGENENARNNQAEEMEEETKRKSYEELLKENEELRQNLDSKNGQLKELERNQQVILEENRLISLGIQDFQRAANDQKQKLEAEIHVQVQEQEGLQNKMEKMKTGIKELNEMLFETILQLNSNGNQQMSSSSAAPTDFNALVPFAPPPSSSYHPYQQLTIPQSLNLNQPLSSEPNVMNSAVMRTPDSQATPTNRSLAISQRFSRSSVKKQIHQCLESIPSLSRFPASTSKALEENPENDKTTAQSLKRKKKKKRDKVLHAVDNQRPDGFYCTCGTEVTSKANLNLHVKYHTWERQFRCSVPDCGKRYFTLNSLKVHSRVQHGIIYNGREGCRKCGKTFVHRMQLLLHYKNDHKGGPFLSYFKWQQNQKELVPTSVSQPTSNQRSSLNGRAIPKPKKSKSLQLTPKVVDTNVNVKSGPWTDPTRFQMRHELDISKLEERLVYCVCGRDFNTKRYLDMHINYFSSEPKFRCEPCGKMYNNMSFLGLHMRMKHDTILQGNGCKLCGRIFQTRMALNQHLKRIHKKLPEEAGSYQAEAKTKTPSRLPVMERVNLRRNRKTPAKYLEESVTPFSHRRSNMHVSRLNRDLGLDEGQHCADLESPHENKCICGATYSTRKALRCHIRLRAKGNGNILECKLCLISFSSEDEMRSHLKTVHYGLPPPNHNPAGFRGRKQRLVGDTKEGASTKDTRLSFEEGTTETDHHGISGVDEKTKFLKCLCEMNFPTQKSLREHIRLKMGLVQASV